MTFIFKAFKAPINHLPYIIASENISMVFIFKAFIYRNQIY